jgi:hypothetical protein
MSVNEEIIHYFGYVEDGRADNNTPYFDYKGNAKPESVALTNKFRELNVIACERRREQIKKYGKTPPRELFSNRPQKYDHEISMIGHFDLLKDLKLVDLINFQN